MEQTCAYLQKRRVLVQVVEAMVTSIELHVLSYPRYCSVIAMRAHVDETPEFASSVLSWYSLWVGKYNFVLLCPGMPSVSLLLCATKGYFCPFVTRRA